MATERTHGEETDAPDLHESDELDEAADAEAEAVAQRRVARREREESRHRVGKAAKAQDTDAAQSGSRRSRANEAKRRERSGNPARRGTPTRKPKQPPTLRDWIGALRLRTLSMAIASVMIGSAASYLAEGFHLGIALLALGVALFLQMAVNVANDYSDGVKGTDSHRVGPKRITSSTAVDPKHVRTLAIVLLALGAASGLALAIISGQYWLIAVGAGCVLLAWLYTGGPKPYSYIGLGEIVAFFVFGPVAVLGTMYAMLGYWNEDGVVLSITAGAFSAALMLVNNMRDVETDRAAKKYTLPVLVGRPVARILYALCMLVPFLVLFVFAMAFAYGPIVMLLLVAAVPAVIIVCMAREPKDYNVALGLTSLTALLYAIGLGLTLWGGATGFVFS